MERKFVILIFIDDSKLRALWLQAQRYYLFGKSDQLLRFCDLLDRRNVHVLDESGGKVLLTNPPLM
jgi:hypothetical protein